MTTLQLIGVSCLAIAVFLLCTAIFVRESKDNRPRFTAAQRQQLVNAIYLGNALDSVKAFDALRKIDANTDFDS